MYIHSKLLIYIIKIVEGWLFCMLFNSVRKIKVNNKKNLAFTLAEVLITLGVIGVVSAMTIPTLVSNYRKRQLEVQIKGTYSSIQQAMKYAEDDGFAPDSILINNDDSLKQFFDNSLSQHMKFEQVIINKRPNEDDEVYKIYYPSGNLYGDIGGKNIRFTIAKGAVVYICVYNAKYSRERFGLDTNSDTLVFFFDANGENRPNIMGTDVHLLGWTEKGLVPGGNALAPVEVENSCYNQQGHACLRKIIEDGWVIPDKVWKRAR